MARFSASRSPEVSGRETRNMERSRKIASQGMVLLKNNGALPMTEAGKKIALFGNGARRTVKGGTGSGDVNSRSVTSVEQGLEAAGFTVATKGWLDRYDEAVEAARKAPTSLEQLLNKTGDSRDQGVVRGSAQVVSGRIPRRTASAFRRLTGSQSSG